MAKNKTAATTEDVSDFINKVDNAKKREDSFTLISLFQKITGKEPKMWGPSIIGFGTYHYKYASGHEGDAPLAGFSPRRNALVIYMSNEFEKREELLKSLGKHKSTKACVYFNKLEDIELNVLEKIIINSIADVNQLYPPAVE